VRQWT